MDHRRPQQLDPLCHFEPWTLLIRLPTIFHSFGLVALSDDDELALPENFSFNFSEIQFLFSSLR